MAGFKETKFNDRISTAQAARQAQLDKVKALAAAAKEKAAERAAERLAVATARDERQKLRAEEKRLAAIEEEKKLLAPPAEEEAARKKGRGRKPKLARLARGGTRSRGKRAQSCARGGAKGRPRCALCRPQGARQEKALRRGSCALGASHVLTGSRPLQVATPLLPRSQNPSRLDFSAQWILLKVPATAFPHFAPNGSSRN